MSRINRPDTPLWASTAHASELSTVFKSPTVRVGDHRLHCQVSLPNRGARPHDPIQLVVLDGDYLTPDQARQRASQAHRDGADRLGAVLTELAGIVTGQRGGTDAERVALLSDTEE